VPNESPTAFAEWLVSLRAELAEAEQRGRGEGVRLRVDKVELDVEVTTTREAGAKGGVKFWVVDAGVDGRLKSGRTQRLKLSITPLDASGGVLDVADELDQLPE